MEEDMKMYYAIINGRERKVVETWEECKALTQGYPKNLYRKVSTIDEGNKLIEDHVSNTVERHGFEDRKYHIYSSLTKSRKTPNVVLTIRSQQAVRGYGHFKENISKIVCIIQSPKELNLPEAREVLKWDKRPRYIYEVEVKGLHSEKFTSIFLALEEIFSMLRLYYDDLSILINTDSNLVLHSLSKNVFKNLEVMAITDALYSEALMSLYLQLSTFDGLILNYEAGDRISTEGHYIDLYLKGEYEIYADRT